MFGDPQFAQKIVELGQDPAPTTPAELTAHMRSSYTVVSMLTRMSTATITMGNRMIPAPGVGGVRAQA